MCFETVNSILIRPPELMGLSKVERMTLLVIANHVNSTDQRAWPSYNTISDLSGYSVQAITKAVKTLESKKLLYVSRRRLSQKSNSTNLYSINTKLINSYPDISELNKKKWANNLLAHNAKVNMLEHLSDTEKTEGGTKAILVDEVKLNDEKTEGGTKATLVEGSNSFRRVVKSTATITVQILPYKVIEQVKEQVIEQVKDITPKKSPVKRFVKPSTGKIEQKAFEINREKNYSFTTEQIQDIAEEFFNYYESNGWKVGRNSMKNWTSSLANWMRKNIQPVGNSNYSSKSKSKVQNLMDMIPTVIDIDSYKDMGKDEPF